MQIDIAMDCRFIAFSEKGIRRSNQDICRIIEMPEHNRSLFVLCDGMGGHDMGDVAAETVCNALCEYWIKHAMETDSEVKVRKACAVAWKELYERSVRVRQVEMGTTLVMASVEGDRVTVANCGDSRCYLFREGQLVYQTVDHAEQRNGWEVVTRCFFSQREDAAVPDITSLTLQQGDRVFLCSDGVCRFVPENVILDCAQSACSLESAEMRLRRACEESSKDNYSGIFVSIGG